MPAADLSSYKVAASELSSSTKFNNLVQAIQDEFGDIDADQIPGYPSDATKFLRGDGSWAVPGTTVTYQTTLPGSPTDGQETILVDNTSTPTYAWRMRYNATLTKWEYIGGRPAINEVLTSENTSSTSYAALATAGPSFAIPIAGDYYVQIGFRGLSPAAGLAQLMSYDIGGTGAVDADSAFAGASGAGSFTGASMIGHVKTGLTAVTLTAKYKVTGSNANFAHRVMLVHPVKL